jgi:hypothetical protein
MAKIIKCPICGKDNPSDLEFCQNCRSRLEPLTGPLKGMDATIKPGQAPTRKNTAELEPILPQWLRDARDSARKSAEDEAVSQVGKQSRDSFSASGSDLLAGLQSHAESDDEEIPDWLTSITGDPAKSKKAGEESPEVRWVELGGAKDFAPKETPVDSSNQKEEIQEINDWFRDASGSLKSHESEQASSADSFITSSDTPDWLRQMAAEHETKIEDSPARPFDAIPASSDTPDWLHQLGEEASKDSSSFFTDPEPSADAVSALPEGEPPDWLSSLGGSQGQTPIADSASFAEPVSGEREAAEIPAVEGLPDWMKGLQSTEPEQSARTETPAWLKDDALAASESLDNFELPSWLSSAPAEPEQPVQADNLPLGDIPGWLKSAAPQSSIYADLPTEKTAQSSDEDWIDSFKSAAPAESSTEESQAKLSAAFSTDEPVDKPAFTPDSQSSLTMDSLFTDMPDWLSNAMEEPSSAPAAAVNNLDSLTPGELPSWVQAMRPVEAGAVRSTPSDQISDSRGALAGFQGVLPLTTGFVPTSKPKVHSIRLQVSDEQRAQATMLEQILAAETAPEPIASFSALPTSRGLRWLIAFVLLAVLGSMAILRTQIFSLPVGVPFEISGAMNVSQAIPEGAPVLVAFDYEPARVGEMEAAASPMFNLMKNPNFTFISTNETGAILAERFISGPLADTDQSGIQRLNLGYLPGGQMGIRAFAQHPSYTFPQLNGIASLSQFAALIIITDTADSARAWIEQTSSTRGTIPVVVISSAQSAPMIRPYYDSQQISGLVSGLYGSAVFEQNIGGGSGISRNYWDTYSIGMLLAMALILGGGLFNLVLGLRDRALSREAK